MLFFEIQALYTPNPGKGLCKRTLFYTVFACWHTHTSISYACHDVAGGQLQEDIWGWW